jgi:3-oxoacyl-[acyl-carrier protein] reductase
MVPFHIRINVIAPGIIDTAMPRVDLSEEQIYLRTKAIPCDRIGKPYGIAAMVLFLVSSNSDWITGQTFHVNGGELMP